MQFLSISISLPLPPQNMIMQQPLCHLYFLTLLENLISETRGISSLIIDAQRLSQVRKGGQGINFNYFFTTDLYSQLCTGSDTRTGEKIILQIEKQAVIQALLREIACQFAPNKMAPFFEVTIWLDSLHSFPSPSSPSSLSFSSLSIALSLSTPSWSLSLKISTFSLGMRAQEDGGRVDMD